MDTLDKLYTITDKVLCERCKVNMNKTLIEIEEGLYYCKYVCIVCKGEELIPTIH